MHPRRILLSVTTAEQEDWKPQQAWIQWLTSSTLSKFTTSAASTHSSQKTIKIKISNNINNLHWHHSASRVLLFITAQRKMTLIQHKLLKALILIGYITLVQHSELLHLPWTPLSSPEHAVHQMRETQLGVALYSISVFEKTECQRVLREEHVTRMNNNMAILVAAEKCDSAASYCMEQLIL